MTRTDYSDSTFTEQIWECCHVGETRAGRVVAGQDRVNARTKLFHDHRGLPTMSIDTAGKITRLGYDDAGRMTTLTDPMNRVTTWKYDSVGRMERKIYPDTTYEKINWLNMAQPETLRNRRGQVSTVSFDFNGNLKAVTGTGVNLTRTYDEWDRLKTVVDSNYSSSVHTFDYDLLCRVTSLDGPWNDDTLAWQYLDAERKVIRTTPGGVTETIIADTMGRVGSIANPLGTFTPGYDGDTSRLLDITHSGGFDTAFTYLGADDDRALETITSKLPNATTIAKHTYGYDDQSRIDSWRREAPLANPSGTTHPYQWTNYYDFSSQLTAVAGKSLTGTLENGWDYQHDLAGNITSVQNSPVSGGPATLTRRNHNATNQITSLGGGGTSVFRGTLSEPGEASVGLTGSGDKPARMLADNRFETELPLQPGSNSIAATDTSGNRSNYQFQVDVASQSTLNFGYDLDGNLTSDGTRSYEWDILSRLTKITWATGKTTDFKYNALDQRCDRTDTDGSTVTKHFHLFVGLQMLDHRSGTTASTATIDRRYLSQGEQRKNGANWENYYYYCRDHLGSIREVVKSAGTPNTLVARYDYDPYGKRLPQYEASGYTCDLGYTGHITVPSLVVGQSEMVLALFRIYDPHLGIWLSADPMGEAGGINLYAYCHSNPLNFYDPDGLMMARPDWMLTNAEIWDALNDGFFATLDGAIPLWDSFMNTGKYSPCESRVGTSQMLGGISRDAAIALATGGGATFANFAAQAKNPWLYELGSTTLRPGTWRFLKHTSVVNRGLILRAQHGGIVKAFWRDGTSFFRALPNWSSGLTPLGSTVAAGGVHGLDALSKEVLNQDECDK